MQIKSNNKSVRFSSLQFNIPSKSSHKKRHETNFFKFFFEENEIQLKNESKTIFQQFRAI